MKKGTQLANRKLSVLVIAGLVICLVAFSKLLGSFLASAEPAQSLVTLQHGHVISDHKSSSIPLFPDSGPFESSGKDEVESKDECDDDINKLVASLNAESESRHAKDQLLFHLQESIENRASVSLFVLYHCWKSFPA